jgi:Ca-activated chloride channel family protein
MENGKEQEIVQFVNLADSFKTVSSSIDEFAEEADDLLSIVLLLDNSHSMKRKVDGISRYDQMKIAGLRLLNELGNQDQIVTIGFNSESWDISRTENSIDETRVKLIEHNLKGGKTAVFDAVMKAIEILLETSGRRIIVLCSDGEDTASQVSLKDVVLKLQSTDITLYSLATAPNRWLVPKGREALSKMSESSGGSVFIPSDYENMPQVMDQIRKAIRSQYLIGYHPSDPNLRGWRNIEIDCRIPFVQLRYKKTYLF